MHVYGSTLVSKFGCNFHSLKRLSQNIIQVSEAAAEEEGSQARGRHGKEGVMTIPGACPTTFETFPLAEHKWNKPFQSSPAVFLTLPF
jgi:hypothetical protein